MHSSSVHVFAHTTSRLVFALKNHSFFTFVLDHFSTLLGDGFVSTAESFSGILSVPILDAPSMRSKTKVISITVRKGTEVRLACQADGNPQPAFTWHKNSDLVSSGFNSSWNVSILVVQHTGDEDFARFVCTAKNRVGSDALTFVVQHARGIFLNDISSKKCVSNSSAWISKSKPFRM